MSREDAYQARIGEAHEELAAARRLIAKRPQPRPRIVAHCHAAVVSTMRAALAREGRADDKTTDLLALLEAQRGARRDLEAFEPSVKVLMRLNASGKHTEVSEEDVHTAVETATMILSEVLGEEETH